MCKGYYQLRFLLKSVITIEIILAIINNPEKKLGENIKEQKVIAKTDILEAHQIALIYHQYK